MLTLLLIVPFLLLSNMHAHYNTICVSLTPFTIIYESRFKTLHMAPSHFFSLSTVRSVLMASNTWQTTDFVLNYSRTHTSDIICQTSTSTNEKNVVRDSLFLWYLHLIKNMLYIYIHPDKLCLAGTTHSSIFRSTAKTQR